MFRSQPEQQFASTLVLNELPVQPRGLLLHLSEPMNTEANSGARGDAAVGGRDISWEAAVHSLHR